MCLLFSFILSGFSFLFCKQRVLNKYCVGVFELKNIFIFIFFVFVLVLILLMFIYSLRLLDLYLFLYFGWLY